MKRVKLPANMLKNKAKRKIKQIQDAERMA